MKRIVAGLRSRRPAWLTRPVAVLVAVLVGVGGLSGAAGAALAELGSTGAEHGHVGGHGDRHDRGADDDGPGAVFGP